MARASIVEAVIFIGIQGSGKSTFFKERFFATHVRVNLDTLRTRHRERLLLEACLQARQPFVVDNTNPTREARAGYLAAARAAGFRVVGYYFQSRIADALARNAQRTGAARVPDKGVRGTHSRLQRPTRDEGFDELYYVQIDEARGFVVEVWQDEI